MSAASGMARPAFATSRVYLEASTISSAPLRASLMGSLSARQAAFAVSQSGSGILAQQLFQVGCVQIHTPHTVPQQVKGPGQPIQTKIKIKLMGYNYVSIA